MTKGNEGVNRLRCLKEVSGLSLSLSKYKQLLEIVISVKPLTLFGVIRYKQVMVIAEYELQIWMIFNQVSIDKWFLIRLVLINDF